MVTILKQKLINFVFAESYVLNKFLISYVTFAQTSEPTHIIEIVNFWLYSKNI